MNRAIRRIVFLLGATLLIAAPAAAQPSGTMTFGVHVTLATRWLDPADTDSEITPFMILYALHDALVKPMPGNLNAPCLAESWTVSKDGRTWDFVLRKGARFHNGDPVTAEDVKFSFERYKGAAALLFKDRVREVQLRGVFVGATGSAGNASTRIEPFATARGVSSYGTIPDVDGLFQRQLQEMDRKKREEMLHQIQRLLHERVVFAPIWENGFIRASGPRVEESGLTLIPAFPYSGPLEDVRLKK